MWITFTEKPRRPIITGREGNWRKVDKLEVDIYVKSHFRGNPRGAGEASAVVEYIDRLGKSHIRKQSVSIENSTKNALSLKISIAAMRILLKPCHVTIHIDSDYIANAMQQGWMERWQEAGWKKANGKPPANVGEWKQLYMLAQIHDIRFEGAIGMDGHASPGK